MNPSHNDLIELENRQRTERLSAKVSQLKHFAVDIERETKDHNRLLDDTGNDFEGIFGYLLNGKNKINRLLLTNRGNRKLMFYFAIIFMFFLFMVYCLISKSLQTKEN